MSAQIVTLKGEAVSAEAAVTPKPNEVLVKELERLLEAAKAGQIAGMAAAYHHHDHAISYSYAGSVGGFGLIGGLDCLKERLVQLALGRS
jgi:hypothetical protein